MLVRDADGKIVIISRKDYSTDKGYYQKISTFRKGGAKFSIFKKDGVKDWQPYKNHGAKDVIFINN